MELRSTAFEHNQTTPRNYTGEGEDISPALSWSEVPANTKEFALIMDDPDAPRPQPWVHWVIYNIPAEVTSLPEGIPPKERLETPRGALQGLNTWEKVGYGGPLPPKGHGIHHYHFRLYALDAPLNLAPSETKESLLQAMQGHILEQTVLTGTYQR